MIDSLLKYFTLAYLDPLLTHLCSSSTEFVNSQYLQQKT